MLYAQFHTFVCLTNKITNNVDLVLNSRKD